MRPASELAAAIRSGALSAVEATRLHLDAITGPGAALNAVVALDADRALADAAAVDAAVAAGGAPGPLGGVPMTVKDAFAVEGMTATAGMPELAGRVADRDAPAVALLRAAGAVILGKTNTPRQLADLQCDNPVHGRTHNPWDLSLSPGGSSGGSAAAVAAGIAPVDLGSDLSGSIRVPASWCGIYGLRMSNGLVSKRDHLPWPLGGRLEPPTSVVGPLGRSVADLALVYSALTGDGGSLPRTDPATLCIGVWSSFPGAPVDTETAAVLDATAARLEEAGVKVEECVPPLDPATALELAWRLVSTEIVHGFTAEQWAAAGSGPPEGRMTQLVHDHLADLEARLRLTEAWDDAMDGRYDALLCPAVATAARPHDPAPRPERTVAIAGVDHPFDVLASWSVLASVAHMPSVTFPAGPGSTSGLPIGLQLLGRHRRDRSLLGVAAAVDSVIQGWRPPPGW